MKLLAEYLNYSGVLVKHTGEKNYANVVIVKKAFELTVSEQPVVVNADDT
jgi:hypothetical protein